MSPRIWKYSTLPSSTLSGHPCFLEIEKDVQNIARIAAALAGGVTLAEFIHGKENLSPVLQTVAEREQRKARPAVAHIKGRGGPPLRRVVQTDHPSPCHRRRSGAHVSASPPAKKGATTISRGTRGVMGSSLGTASTFGSINDGKMS